MASTTQDKLYQTFVAVGGQQDSNPGGALDSGEEIAASLSDTVRQLSELQGSSAAQAASGSSTSTADATSSGSTPAADATSTSNASTTSGGGISAESIVTTVLESGLGMVPLVVGLLGLFGGGGTPAPTTLEKYAMPERQYFEGADTGSGVPSGLSGADYDQMGMPRAYSAAPDGGSAQTSGSASPGSSSSDSGAPSGPSGAGAAQITVNVQAMDSQSFLDHSNEIAQAVRAAMLNSNSINDVVNNL
jgi:hypothetical protein